jgi:hypothetical protein
MNAHLPTSAGCWAARSLPSFEATEYQQGTTCAPLRIASSRGRHDKLARLRGKFGEVLIMCANQRGTN